MSHKIVLNTRQEILVSKNLDRIPRGEMWLSHGLFQELGWKDSLESRLQLCHDLGMDALFLSVDILPRHNNLFDYRYFSLDEVSGFLAENRELLAGLIVDGPFQRLVRKADFQLLLGEWQTSGGGKVLQEESVQVSQLISACLQNKPDILVIADDIAYSCSTYVSPSDLEQSLFVLYREWVQQAHARHILAFFHSDGNLSSALQGLLACGFDGLAGCELECLDIAALKQQYGSELTFLTGIPTSFLEEEPLPNSRRQFIQLLRGLASGGRFMLCSSRGLSSAKHMSRLQTLYQWADQAWNRSKRTQDLLCP